MLLELYDFGIDPRVLHIGLGLALGLLFGIAAQISRFCLRRAIDTGASDRQAAAGVWMAAFAAGVLALWGAGALGFADLSGHRWISADLPIVAIVLGGLAFGVGMVLTRGCMSRLTVLGASGNLRALTVIVVFAVIAHAMLKGVLSPLREALVAVTVTSPVATLADLPGGAALWAPVVALPLLVLAWRSGASLFHLGLGALIGLVVAAGWAGTSVLLLDEFDPLPVQSVAFTLTWTETLFWTIASTALPATFGVGFVGGVLGGAFLSALFRGELHLQSFETPEQTLRYALGAVLMGVGGVLAGGCTVGAGLAGGATLSVAALLALGAIIAGAMGASLVLAGASKAGSASAVA